VAFQNCAKKDLNDLQTDASAQQSVKSEDLSAVSPSNAVEINFANSLDGVSFSVSSKPIARDLDVYEYSLNLESGVIKGLDTEQKEIAGKNFCLKDAELSELKAILETAKMCGAQQNTDPQLICTAIYREPYAELVFEDKAISVGEATSGCSKGADLCGAHADLLKAFIKSVVVDMANKSCDFEAL
jgi:hypothetical protein